MSSNDTWKAETEKRYKFVAWHFGKQQRKIIEDFIAEASILNSEELKAINAKPAKVEKVSP